MTDLEATRLEAGQTVWVYPKPHGGYCGVACDVFAATIIGVVFEPGRVRVLISAGGVITTPFMADLYMTKSAAVFDRARLMSEAEAYAESLLAEIRNRRPALQAVEGEWPVV